MADTKFDTCWVYNTKGYFKRYLSGQGPVKTTIIKLQANQGRMRERTQSNFKSKGQLI